MISEELEEYTRIRDNFQEQLFGSGHEKFLLPLSVSRGIPLRASAAVGDEDHCVHHKEKESRTEKQARVR
jgi:hypothetical protein